MKKLFNLLFCSFVIIFCVSCQRQETVETAQESESYTGIDEIYFDAPMSLWTEEAVNKPKYYNGFLLCEVKCDGVQYKAAYSSDKGLLAVEKENSVLVCYNGSSCIVESCGISGSERIGIKKLAEGDEAFYIVTRDSGTGGGSYNELPMGYCTTFVGLEPLQEIETAFDAEWINEQLAYSLSEVEFTKDGDISASFSICDTLGNQIEASTILSYTSNVNADSDKVYEYTMETGEKVYIENNASSSATGYCNLYIMCRDIELNQTIAIAGIRLAVPLGYSVEEKAFMPDNNFIKVFWKNENDISETDKLYFQSEPVIP